jgi:hypothetical protein
MKFHIKSYFKYLKLNLNNNFAFSFANKNVRIKKIEKDAAKYKSKTKINN